MVLWLYFMNLIHLFNSVSQRIITMIKPRNSNKNVDKFWLYCYIFYIFRRTYCLILLFLDSSISSFHWTLCFAIEWISHIRSYTAFIVTPSATKETLSFDFISLSPSLLSLRVTGHKGKLVPNYHNQWRPE